MNHEINIKRVYDAIEAQDGYRILVDRMWPRGIKKENLQLDDWPKDITPSVELKKEFQHKMDQAEAFTKAYRAELDDNQKRAKFLQTIQEKLKSGNIMLLSSSKPGTCSNVTVLKDWLIDNLK